MKTIKISNGRLSRDENGLMEIVEGANKSAQDVPNALLCSYNPFFDSGSNLTTLDFSSDVAELAVDRAIYDSIYRWISKQVSASQDSRILRVNKILVRQIDLTSVVFYVEVLHESGNTAEFATSLTSTQLEHLLDIDKVYK